MIKAFIFDIGNVLLRFDFDLALRKIEPLSDNPEGFHGLDALKCRYEEGAISRHEFQEEVKKAIGFRGTDHELVSAWEDIFEENIVMTDFVREIEGRFPVYLLSNTSDLHINFIFSRFPVFNLFKDAVYSFEARCSKPSPEIYRIAAAQFGAKPEETVFIDDLGPNVETAKRLGFRAFQYDFERHDAFTEWLAGEGVEG